MRDRVVPNYYLLQVTRSVGFITPVFTLFLLRDLSFTQVGTLGAIYSGLVVAGEVPTGYVGDRVGRRASVAVSVLLKAASIAGFVLAQSFPAYVLFYVLWAFGMTFASGSLDAWLYDTLDERLDASSFTRVRGRGAAVEHATSMVTAVGGGVLYTLSPTWPFVASVALNLLGFLVLFTLPKNRAYRDDGDAVDGDAPDAPSTLTVLRESFGRGSLRPFVAYVALFLAVVSAADTYVQPVFESFVTARFPETLPVGVSLGLLYAAFMLVSAGAAGSAGTIEDRLGVARALAVVPVATAVFLLVPGRVLAAALPAFVVMKGSRSALHPIVNGHVSAAVDDAGRATVLSAVSMATQLVRMPLALGAGMLADATGGATTVAALGAVFLVGGGAVWLLGGPVVAGDPVGDGSAGGE